MATISGVNGTQWVRGTRDYDYNAYQYATSTYGEERNLKPALVVQPKTKEDIVLALKHAREQKIAVAIRSGGHQYSGASSTGGNNIQLDLSESFKTDKDHVLFEKDGKTYARVSVSWSLGEFNAWMGENHVFIPHGQCEAVHVGGHCQTGGYGQLGRSFGLLGDYIDSFEIVDSDGKFRTISRATDPEQFFAWTGGSPGNLGVLTHVTVEVQRDADFLGSRGLKALFHYTPATLNRLLDMLVEMAEDDDFPRNYDFCVSVLSEDFPILDLIPDLDEAQARFRPYRYGENHVPFYPKSIVVYAQWVPFSPTDVPDMSWFARIKKGAVYPLGDGVDVKPMSELTAQWIFRNVREFEHPYVKRTYATASTTLSKDGWAAWATKRIDAIVSDETNRCWLSAQLQCFGGKNSMMRRNAGNGTAYSWRDTTIACTMDCFHDKERKSLAEDWAQVNDDEAIGPEGVFSKEDRRWLWGSHGDWDLDAVWETYYEDREKYERLRRARKAADPYGIFTPNPFCVKRAE